jgi:hypothetical protein
MARPKFRFLTIEEFCALPRGEKIAYIDDACEEVKKMGDDDGIPENIIFAESRSTSRPKNKK